MKDSLISLQSAQINLLNPAARGRAKLSAAGRQVQLLRGRAAILARMEMLEELCRRTGQAGAMHWLEFEMSKPTEAKKIPTLLLVGLNENVEAATATADDVVGAVMLYEYKFAGQGIMLFATDDTTGVGTVTAPAHRRSEVAEAACGCLMDLGAVAALVTFTPEAGEERNSRRRSGGKFRMARQVRSVPLCLALGETLEETLAGLGKHTRRNLRYYRRRLESDLGSEYVPQVEMSRSDFMKFNRASINPGTDGVAGWRYDSTQGAGMMFAGTRAKDGQWLSLIGGRRHETTLKIDWQMNRAGLERYSLSTVMRSYVLEHETGLGMKTMVFTGGTPHSMRHSFTRVDAMDLIVLRRSFAGTMLRWMARCTQPGNFLGQTLRDKDLRWE